MKLFDPVPKALAQAIFSDMIEKYSLYLYDDAYGPALKNKHVILYFYANELEELTLYISFKDITLSFNILMQNLYGDCFSEDWDNKIDPLISEHFSGSSGIHIRALYHYKFLMQKYMLNIINGTDFSFLPKLSKDISNFNSLWKIMETNKIYPSWRTKGTRKYGFRKPFNELNEDIRTLLFKEGIELPKDLPNLEIELL